MRGSSMDLLQAEIDRKRQLAEQLVAPTGRKYLRRGELQLAQLRTAHASVAGRAATPPPAAPTAALAAGSAVEPQQAPPPSTASAAAAPPPPAPTRAAPTALHRPPAAEVVRRLRARGQPIRLFGETDEERAQRLHDMEVQEPDAEEGGLRNDFREALDAVDQEYLDELLRKDNQQEDDAAARQEDSEDVMDESEIASRIGELRGLSGGLDKMDAAESASIVLRTLKLLLRIMESDLNARTREAKLSATGKVELARYKQTRNYIRPLFKKLKTRVCARRARSAGRTSVPPTRARLTRRRGNRRSRTTSWGFSRRSCSTCCSVTMSGRTTRSCACPSATHRGPWA